MVLNVYVIDIVWFCVFKVKIGIIFFLVLFLNKLGFE